MQIFRDVLAVPGIPAESENQGTRTVRCIGWNVDAVQRFAVRSAEREPLRAGRQRAGRRDGVDREDEVRLEFKHGKNRG